MVIERIIATFKSRNYEKNTSVLFHVVWITITSIVALLNVLSSIMLEYLSIALFTYSSLFLLAILEIWALFWILNHNKRNYEKRLLEGCHNLSERYQISENIRTSKQLLPCIIMHLMNIILPGINIYLTNFKIYSGQFNQDFVEECLYIVTTIVSFFIELSMIIFHPFLKRDLLNYFQIFFGWCPHPSNNVSPSDTNDVSSTTEYRNIIKLQPMDLHGRPLISDKKGDEFSKEYFKQLTISWQ
ncbi:hypothetical protein ACQ4LE_005079 [Meloidogyne hapla]